MSTDSQSSSILLVNDCKTRVTSLKPSISPSAMCWSRWAESNDHFSRSINCVPAKWTFTFLSNSNSHWNVGTCTKNLYRVYWFFLLFFLSFFFIFLPIWSTLSSYLSFAAKNHQCGSFQVSSLLATPRLHASAPTFLPANENDYAFPPNRYY